MIGHVEGGEAGVGVAEHGLDGVVSINTAPTPTGLPHSVEDSAYIEGIVLVGERDSPGLLGSYAAPHANAQGPSPGGGGGGFDMREIGKDGVYSGCHCHLLCGQESGVRSQDKRQLPFGFGFGALDKLVMNK